MHDRPFGGPFGPRPFGGPFGGGRGRRRRGDVRTALLLLFADEPLNGYQAMAKIEDLSGGRWRPSPGSVYPVLAQLEDEGLIRSTETEAGRAYELTDKGREEIAARGERPAPWEASPEGDATHELRMLIMSTGKAAWQVAQDGNAENLQKAIDLLTETRRSLYRILAGDAEV